MKSPETRMTGAGLSSDTPTATLEQDLPGRDVPRAANMPADEHTHDTSVAASHGDRLNVPGSAPAVRRGIGAGVWIALLIVALAVAAVIVYGILARRGAEHTLEHVTVEAAVPAVSVIHPSTARIGGEISLPGAVQAYTDTPIYSRTNGYLRQWFFDIGAHVRKGQLMATIETPEVDQQLQVAQADLKSAQANLNLANTTRARYETLLKSNSVSKQETDEAVGGALARQAAVEAAEAAVRRLQQLQSFERIYAPFDGIVTARNTDVGDLIVAGQEGAGNGQNQRELFHLAAVDRLRVFVPVPEADAATISNGEHATLTSDALPGKTVDGVVTRNANAVDPTTRTLNVEVDLTNQRSQLLPGAYVFVHFRLPQTGNSLTLPANTLLFRAEGLRVGVVRSSGGVDRVQLVPVTIAHDGGATVEISSGLAASDQVIVDPSDSIASGQQVKVKASQGTLSR